MPRLTILVVSEDPTGGAAAESLAPERQDDVAAEEYEVVAVRGAAVGRAVAGSRAEGVAILSDDSRPVTPGTVAEALRNLGGLGRGVTVVEPGLVLLGRASPGPDPADRYVELLMQALLNEHGLDAEAAFFAARDALEAGARFDDAVAADIRASRPELFEAVAASRATGLPMAWASRNLGFAYTMIGRARLENVAECATAALDDAVPGDLVECGVWRGGVPILMRGILAARGITDRTVWAADSFDGLPRPDSQDTLDITKETNPELAVSEARVREAFARFGLLDEQVRFVPGWFKDTLPSVPIERIAVLRLDGDLYSSTTAILTALYDKVSPGGFVIVDDYKFLDECRLAVDEFRAARGIEDPIVDIDWNAVYWRRSL